MRQVHENFQAIVNFNGIIFVINCFKNAIQSGIEMLAEDHEG